MAYLTTFNAVFFSLVALTVVTALGGLIAAKIAVKRGKAVEFDRTMRAARLKINGGWVAVLVLSGFLSLSGTVTFLFYAIILGVALGVLIGYLQDLKTQRMVKESTRQALDMLGLGS